MNHDGLTKPPEGVLAGETVPRENETDDNREVAIDRIMGTLKALPEYRDYSDAELLEKATDVYRRTQ